VTGRIREIPSALWVRDKDVWPHGCSVYVIEEQRPGPVKVGIAEHPIRRLGQLQVGNPRELNLRAVFVGNRPDCAFVEAAIKFRFSGSLLRGEWLVEPLESVLREVSDLARES
jgi:hypothetical protein